MSENPKAGQSTARAAKQFKRRMLLKSGVALAALILNFSLQDLFNLNLCINV